MRATSTKLDVDRGGSSIPSTLHSDMTASPPALYAVLWALKSVWAVARSAWVETRVA